MLQNKTTLEHSCLIGFALSAVLTIYGVATNKSATASMSTAFGAGSLALLRESNRKDNLKQLSEDRRETQKQLIEESESLTKAQAQLTTLQTSLDAFRTPSGDLYDVSRLNAEIDRLKADLEGCQKTSLDLQRLKITNDDLISKLATSDKTLSEKDSEVNKWSGKFDVMISENLKEVDRLNAALNAANRELDQYKVRSETIEENATLRASVSSQQLKEELEKYKQIAPLYQAARDELLQKCSEYQNDISQFEVLATALPQSFDLLTDERDRQVMQLSGQLNLLLQPQYFNAVGEYGRRANQLITTLYEGEESITLDASEIVPYADKTGFEVYYNLRDRQSRGQAFTDALNDRGNEFQELCGCIETLKFTYDPINPHRIKTDMRFHKAQKVGDKTAIDKLWIPSVQFEKVYKLLKKPVTRIMGSTGEGKGIFANLLLAIEANQSSPAFTQLHDPMNGSSEDYWQIPKVSKDKSATKKAVKSFADTFNDRLENSVSSPITLDVFDEIDIVADEDSSINKAFLTCSKGARHNGMKAYLIGQSPSVGKKGWEWADMDNFNAVYFGTAIITAIDKTPSLSSKSDDLKKQYQKLRDFCDKQNEDSGLDGWNEYRVGLLVSGGKATFFELPNADSIACDWDKLSQQTEVEILESKTDSVKSQPKSLSDSLCPECGSDKLQNKGKARNGNSKYVVCKDCNHRFKVSL